MPILLVLLSGCGTSTVFLKKDQYLFVNAKIKGNDKVDSEDLQSLQQQKPNRKVPLLGTPYLYFYQVGEKLYDKKKVEAKIERIQKKYDDKLAKVKDPGSAKAIRLRNLRDQKLDKQRTVLEEGNWLMRTVGEPPSIFDPSAMGITAREMRNYLFNKGFFDGRVTAKIDTLSRRRIEVVYNVTEGPPQIIRTVRDTAYDARLSHILDSLTTKPSDRMIRPGDRYDQDKISEERERIDKAIRNSGYYAFARDYIFIDADTGIEDSALGTRAIDLRFRIANPRKGAHERYRIGEVDFHINQGGGFFPTDTTLFVYRDVSYHTPYRRFSYRTLDSKMLVRPGSYYNADNLTQSQAQLQAMDFFRFVNFSFDTLPSGRAFRLNIQASRLPKYQVSDEIGMLVSQGAPGPFVNLGFKIRNALNKFDIVELSGRYSQEGQISVFNQQGVYRARELGVNASITFPAIVFPGRTSYLFNDKNPKTRITAGYTALKRPEYSQNIIKASVGYSINLSTKEVVGLNVIDASIVKTVGINPSFYTFLREQQERGNSLIQSFNNQIVTSLSGFYVYNTSSQTAKVRGQYFRIFAEAGGFIPNSFAQTFGDTGRYLRNNALGIDLRVFRFTKVQVDYRYYYPVGKNMIWVARINTGIGVPLGDTKVLPYIKYFFAGGSNSIRAWAPRRLGPGRYSVAEAGGFYAEQPGEILFEGSVEVRRKLIGFLEGALFADFGNVYTLNNDLARPGGQFKLNSFVSSMALGIGPGLRMDFSFLVVRLDLGIKTYDPARPYGTHWVIKDLFKPVPESVRNYQRAVLNIGIGYPF